MTQWIRMTGALAAVLGVAGLSVPGAEAQLRVATWNITAYTGGHVSDIQTAVYGEFEGRSFAPDVILGQEFMSLSAAQTFRDALNSAPGSPGTWVTQFFGGEPGYEGSVILYRSDKCIYRGGVVISSGGSYPNPPRDTVRFKLWMQGYAPGTVELYLYNSHMKAGSASEDRTRRLTEAQRIRDDAEELDPDAFFLLGADLNMASSSEAAYQELVGSQPDNNGRFFDPISSPGTWYSVSGYRFVHTQDPIGAGGMDDRYDQILISDNLRDGEGFDYLGYPDIPYSTTTWNDANHSHRAWGNDGTSFNTQLTVTGNQMVGAAIAQALKNLASPGGHLPVFLDIQVPALIDADAVVDFGQVPVGVPAEALLEVWNEADAALWGVDGIETLFYNLTADPGFAVSYGPFVAGAGDPPDQHVVTMDTSTLGLKTGTLTILSNAHDDPVIEVTLQGEVVEDWLVGDMNCDEVLGFADVNPFVLAVVGRATYEAAFPGCNWYRGDVNDDGTVDVRDINPFVVLLASPP